MNQPRKSPYGAFNFLVTLPDSGEVIGGFSDVSDLNPEITVAEYRDGAGKENRVGKIPRPRKSANVTLKRGVVASALLSAWISQAARRDLVITLRDEQGAPVRRWILHGALPAKWTGPTLAAKGSDVAMEELVLSSEGLSVE